MPLDPAGNFSLLPSYFAEPGTTIRTESHNPVLEDIANVMSMHLVRDGRNGMVGNLNMGSFAIRNLAPGTNPTDAATVSQGVPIGASMEFAGSTAPSGWMFEFGQAVSRTTYAALFAVIGTTYGAGDGSTTFNLPDCRGRVTAGKDDMGGTAAGRLNGAGTINGNVLGAVGGAQTVALTAAQNGPHVHGVNDPGHSHPYVRPNTIGSNINVGPTVVSTTLFASTTSLSTTGITIQSSGEGAAHVNVQPTIIKNKIIKVSV